MPTFSYIYSIPYIILFLLLYLNTIPLYKTNSVFLLNSNIRLQEIFASLLLIFFLGFRGFVATDWQSYYPIYYSTPKLYDGIQSINNFLKNPWENGFLLYMIICKTISSNYLFFQLISFIIDFIIIYYFIKRIIPKYIVMGILFFILFSGIVLEFNLLRNSKAIMLFIISLKYIEDKKFIKYVILNVVGALFHITSILYLPLYFILNKKIPRIVILILFCIGNLIFLIQFKWCKVIITSIYNIIPGRLGLLINRYLSPDRYTGYGISIGYLERSFSFVVFFIFSQKLYKINKNNLIYLNTFYLYVFIFLYFSEIAIILDRVTILFIFPYWIIYPQIYSLLDKSSKKLYLLFLLVYGILRFGVGCKDIYFLYDNVLIKYKSYQERLDISNNHSKFIYNK